MKWTLKLELVDRASNLRSTVTGFKEPVGLPEAEGRFACHRMATRIAALFITVDPARDTPETLKSYLENFDLRIIGLTGDSAKIQTVTKSFKVFVKKVPGENGDYTVDHTTIVYLMDKRGRFVNTFNLANPPKQAAYELEKYL